MIFQTQKGTKRDNKWELYQSTLGPDNQWSTPVPLTSINEKLDFIAGPSLNYQGNVLYYTAYIDGVTQTEDIYYSERVGDQQWSEPKPLGPPVNTAEEYEGFPSISADGQSLYFIRLNKEFEYDRKSKEACFKIYVSRKQADGSWGVPSALPDPVNIACERDPRIMADNHTLIFSSVRDDGKGKYDLYQTRLLPSGNWDEPVALDFVNSPDNDQSPCISASGNLMYYYSGGDIFGITIPSEYRQMINVTLLGQLTAGPERKPTKGVVVVNNTTTGHTYHLQTNEHDGHYSVVMAAGGKYEVTFSSEGYRPQTLTFDYAGLDSYKEERQDVNLSSEWPVPLAVHDKDLKKPVKAWVVITRDDGQQVLADSLDERPLTLATNHRYNVVVTAKDYEEKKQELRFVRQTFREGEPVVIPLTRETVTAVADVTVGVGGQRKRVRVTYENEDTGEVIVADAGEVVNLRKGDRYQVMTSSDKGYSYAIASFVAGEATDENVTTADGPAMAISLPIQELTQGTKLALNHIYFQTNSAELSKSSETELQQIVNLLKQNTEVVIEISAHTDDVGSDAYNNDLSQRRAQSVTDFLAGQGIPRKQLVPKGYGESRPLVPNDSDENRAKNRRVEMLVLEGV